jgi:hypothetical protein
MKTCRGNICSVASAYRPFERDPQGLVVVAPLPISSRFLRANANYAVTHGAKAYSAMRANGGMEFIVITPMAFFAELPHHNTARLKHAV